MIENPAVQGMMKTTASVAVECLNWFGIPAWQKANLIEVPTGVVGVNEACSGIRSLQSAIMMSLFWGEFHRLRVRARFALLTSSLLLTVALNLVRTFTLAWIAAKYSPGMLDHFHDPAGWAIAGIVFISVWTIGNALKHHSTAAPIPIPVPNLIPISVPVPVPSAGPAKIHFSHDCFALGLMILLIGEAGRILWFSHSTESSSDEQWMEFRSNESGGPTALLQPLKIPEAVNQELRASSTRAFIWKNWHGTEGRIFLFTWSKGTISTTMSGVHQPEICLPAVGMALEESYTPKEFQVAGQLMATKAFRFKSFNGQEKVFVLHTKWNGYSIEQKPGSAGEKPGWKMRLSETWRGRLSDKQQVLEIALSGASDFPEALTVAHQMLSQTIRFNPR